MPAHDVDRIINSLTENQKIVLREISRVEKTGAGFLNIDSLKRKGKIIKRRIGVEPVLEELQSLGLVSQSNPSRHLWIVSRQGKLVEHELERRFNSRQYPELSRVIRR